MLRLIPLTLALLLSLPALGQTPPAAPGAAMNGDGLWHRLPAVDPGDSSFAYPPALSPDGRILAYFQDIGSVANPRTRVTVWSVDPPSVLFSEEFSAGPGYEMRFSDSGRLLHVIVGDSAAVLNVQDRRVQFQVEASLEGIEELPATAAISPDDSLLALGLADGGYRVLSTQTGSEIASDASDPFYPATRLWWSTPNSFIARARNYVLSLVNEDGEWHGGFGPYQRLLEVSRSGAVFVTRDDNSAVVWDNSRFLDGGYGDGAQGMIQRIAHPDGFLVSAALSADETRLVTVSDTSLYLWDVQTGRELLHVRAEALPEPAGAGSRYFLTRAVLIDDPLAILLEAELDLFMIDPESGAILQVFDRADPWTVSANSRTLVTQGRQVWQR